jgi:uncharacterized membrane protein
MTLFQFVEVLHVIGATVLLGTGVGTAFFMLMAHRSGDARFIANTARVVVVADFVFTATAVVAQPITGAWLALQSGTPIWRGWVGVSLVLYVLTGALWLPVVWMQMRMRDLAAGAASAGVPLPPVYHRLWRLWFACGVPAFAAVIGIVFLMVVKPNV